jgi:hypothetical protein
MNKISSKKKVLSEKQKQQKVKNRSERMNHRRFGLHIHIRVRVFSAFNAPHSPNMYVK